VLTLDSERLCREAPKMEGILIVRALVAVAAVVGAATIVVAQQNIAAEQDALMKSIAKSQYGVLSRMARGQSPYDQAAVDGALAQMEEAVGKIAVTFATNPKMKLPEDKYSPSPKVWENKADFESKIPPVLAAIKSYKGKITDAASAKMAFDDINAKCNGCHDTYQVKN
jgi:cytochrome c556